MTCLAVIKFRPFWEIVKCTAVSSLKCNLIPVGLNYESSTSILYKMADTVTVPN